MRWDSIQKPTIDFRDGRQITFRSNWEGNYAIYLDWLQEQGEIKQWEYEPERYKFIRVEGNHSIEIGSYLPDFRVTNNDGTIYIVEVKGYKQGTRKLQRMRKYYPHIRIEEVHKKEYDILKKKVGRMLHWN